MTRSQQPMRPSTTWDTHRMAIRRGWALVMAATILAAVGVYAWTAGLDPRYRAEESVVVTAGLPLDDPSALVDSLRVLTDRGLLGTYAEMAEGAAVSTAQAANLDATKYDVAAHVAQESSVIDLTADGPSASGVTQLMTDVIWATSRRFETSYPVFQVELLGRSEPLGRQIGPTPARDAALAGAVAFVLTYLAALAGVAMREASRPAPADTVDLRRLNGRSHRRNAPGDPIDSVP